MRVCAHGCPLSIAVVTAASRQGWLADNLRGLLGWRPGGALNACTLALGRCVGLRVPGAVGCRTRPVNAEECEAHIALIRKEIQGRLSLSLHGCISPAYTCVGHSTRARLHHPIRCGTQAAGAWGGRLRSRKLTAFGKSVMSWGPSRTDPVNAGAACQGGVCISTRRQQVSYSESRDQATADRAPPTTLLRAWTPT